MTKSDCVAFLEFVRVGRNNEVGIALCDGELPGDEFLLERVLELETSKHPRSSSFCHHTSTHKKDAGKEEVMAKTLGRAL